MNTPPPLKWLAEKRGRILSQLLKAQLILEEQNRRVAKLQLAAASASECVNRLQLDLHALDRTVAVYDALLDPSAIAPINGWKGRYGERGALSDHIVGVIARNAPRWVGSDVIEAHVVAELHLTFETTSQHRRWRTNSFRGALKRLTYAGVLERQHSATVRQNCVGQWRLHQETTLTLADLATAASIQVLSE